MGLLDNMPGMDTPEGQGLLQAAFSLMSAQKYPGQKGALAGALGDAGKTYLQSSNSSRDAMQRRKFQDAQMEAQQMQLEAARAKQAQDEKDAAIMRNMFSPTSPLGALQGGGGPTMANAQKIGQVPQFDPRRMLGDGASFGALKQGMELNSALNPKPKYETVAAGSSLFKMGPNGPELATTAPRAPAEIDYNKPFLPDGTPNKAYQDYSLSKADRGATRVSMSNVTKQEGEEAKTVGKYFGDAYSNIQQAGFGAQSKINRYSRLGQLLEGVSTGKFAATGLEVAKAASALGLNIDPNMANKEAAQALSSEIALELRNPSGGAGMPGAMSDADRQFLANMVPGLATTPEGRKLMVETATKLAERDKQVAALARDYRKKNGTINEGFYDELARFSEENKLFKSTGGNAGGKFDDASKEQRYQEWKRQNGK